MRIIATHSDESLSRLIANGLARFGVTATADAEALAYVVLISSDALNDAGWRAEIEKAGIQRLVPIRVGPFSDPLVPERLRELNWIIELPESPLFMPRVFAAINTDIGRYRQSRDLGAQAERWVGSGRSDDYLLDSVKEAHRLVLATGGGTPGGADDLATGAREFLERSLAFARRLRRQRIWSLSWRAALAAVTIAAVVSAAIAIPQLLRERTNSVAFDAAGVSVKSRPDLLGIKAASSLVAFPPQDTSDARLGVLATALSQHWSSGWLSPTGYIFAGADFVGPKTRPETLSADGTLTVWDRFGTPTERSALPAGAYVFATNGPGTLAFSSDGALVHRFAASSGRSTAVGKIPGVLRLAYAAASDVIVATDSAGAVWAIDSASSSHPPSPRRLGSWRGAFALQRLTDGHVEALVPDGAALVAVDETGAQAHKWSAPTATSATISPDGTHLALITGSTIWTATSSGDAFADTGIRTGAINALATTDDGLVLVNDRTDGTWLADPLLGIRLGKMCSMATTIDKFLIAPNNDDVLCYGRGGVVVDRIAELRPKATGAVATKPVTSVSAPAGSILKSASITDDFLVLNWAKGQALAVDLTGKLTVPGVAAPPVLRGMRIVAGSFLGTNSAPSSIALNHTGSTLALGLDDGTVVEFDLGAGSALAVVSHVVLPDSAPVTALSWSANGASVLARTSGGLVWSRFSCAGCWSHDRVASVLASRVWFCYADADIATLGEVARDQFELRSCAAPTKAGN